MLLIKLGYYDSTRICLENPRTCLHRIQIRVFSLNYTVVGAAKRVRCAATMLQLHALAFVFYQRPPDCRYRIIGQHNDKKNVFFLLALNQDAILKINTLNTLIAAYTYKKKNKSSLLHLRIHDLTSNNENNIIGRNVRLKFTYIRTNLPDLKFIHTWHEFVLWSRYLMPCN